MTRAAAGSEGGARPDGTVEVVIDSLGAHGDGVARSPRGTLFVPYTAPGDRVRARPVGGRAGRRGDGRAAEPVEILAPGPDRVAPVCPHFGVCGGCATQHLSAAFLRRWKRELVAAALARRGLDGGAVGEVAAMPPGDRRRVDFAAVGRRHGALLGHHARRSHRLVEVTRCPVADPEIEALLGPLRDLLGRLLGPGQRAGVLVTATEGGRDVTFEIEADLGIGERERLAEFAAAQDLARLSVRRRSGFVDGVAARRPPVVRLGDIAVVPPPGAFLQASPTGEVALVAEVAAGVGGVGAVADLFAGCGTFALALAARARVHAVEGRPDMAAALDSAARRAGVTGLTVETRDLFRRPLAGSELDRFGAVILDPPRAGAKAQAEALARSRVPVVVAVSCNPATFARDARVLVDGGYRLVRVAPVDQFPWSRHIELTALFLR